MPPCGRRLALPTSLPPWAVLLSGVMLGCVLTSTFTFHLRWCSDDRVSLGDLSLERQTLSIIRVNEHIRAHGKVDGRWERNADGGGDVESEWDDCVCGDELKRLKGANEAYTVDWGKRSKPAVDPTHMASHYLTKPSVITFKADWNSSNSDDDLVFLNLAAAEGERSREQLLSEEFLLQRSYVVAVLVPDDGLKWASEIYDTWGQDVPQILFFVSETCNKTEPEVLGLPLVTIQGVDGTPDTSVERSFAVIRYLHEQYQEAFRWFVLVEAQTFIWAHHMEQVLSRLDSSKKIYLGWAGRGRQEDAQYLQLLPEENYCLGAPGMALSSAALRVLGGKLSLCLELIQKHNLGERDRETYWRNWDVEIGRCVSRTLGIHCTLSAESKACFYQDFSPKDTISTKVLSSPPFTHLLTYYPVTHLSGHRFLYTHYKQIEYNEYLETAQYLQQLVNSLCLEVEPDDAQRCTVYVCPCEEKAVPGGHEAKRQDANSVTSLEKSYRPVSKFDIPTWQYFDSLAVYDDEATTPAHWFSLRKDRKKEIQSVMNQVLLEARAITGHRLLKFRKVLNGYLRHNPFRGMEYIIDAEYIEGRTLVKTRVSIVRPLARNYISVEDSNDKKSVINFIVPISNVNQRFSEFMSMYEKCCLSQDTSLHLVLVVFGKQDVVFVKSVIQPYLDKFKLARISVVEEGEAVFSRGRALHLGMSSLSPEDLAFHCDVDMTISTNFLNRCRRNTIRGRRVYYPEFFKLYNLDYVYVDKSRPKKLPLKRQHGHWASYSFGMLCMYKSDYSEVGGMDTSIIGWGEEDVKFYEMILKRKHLEVFRAPDPGLTHRWHEKYCPHSLSEEQLKHCISSRGENLADRIQLATYIYDHNLQITYPGTNITSSLASDRQGI